LKRTRNILFRVQQKTFSRSSVSVFDLNDFLLVVGTAVLADAMRHHELAALRALDKIDSTHLPVGSSLISVALGRLILRTNRHPETPPYLNRITADAVKNHKSA
jgi:hypothetical protein